MAINKNFVIKNGVEVNTSLIVGDATLNKVGVGTTVPGYTLHVGGSRGGIGATDITITGIATVGTSGSTSAALSVVGVSTFQGDIDLLGSAGVSTISFDASLDKLNFADNARATFGSGDDLQIYHEGTYSYISNQNGDLRIDAKDGERGIVVLPDSSVELYYDNTKTFNTTPQGINVTGVTTSLRLNVSGISTLDGGVRVGTAASIYTNGNVAFAGLATANGGVQVGTAASIYTNGNIAAAGIVTANGGLVVGAAITLAVNGNASFAGIVTVGGDLKVTGDIEISEDLVLNTNLNLLGIASISNLDNTGAGIGSLSVTGVSTFSGLVNVDAGIAANTAIIEDLTNNRVVIVGSGGELEDSGNLTFDGSTLAVTGDETVSGKITVGSGASVHASTGNAAFAGIVTTGGALIVGAGATISGDILPDADGSRDLGSSTLEFQDLFIDGTANIDALVADTAAIGDLTNNRVVIAGSSGELEDSGNLTFDGSTLAVTGDQTVSGKVSVGSGVTASANGNLAVAGISTFNDNVLVGTGITIQPHGGVSIAGITTIGGNLNVTGNSYFVGMVTFAGGTNGNITLGDSSGDNVVFNADVNSNVIPNTDNAYDLGSSGQQWKDIYVNGIGYIDTVSADGVGIATATIRDSAKLDVDGDARFSGKVAVKDGGNAGAGVTIFDNGNIVASGIVTASTFVGSFAGSIVGAASQVTVADESSDTTCFPLFVTAASGDLAPKSGTNLTFNSDTGALTATSFAGNISGGTVAGSTGTFTGEVDIGGDANNGTAEGLQLNTNGFIQASRGGGVSALFAGYTQGSSTQTVRIDNDGDAHFLGSIGIGTATVRSSAKLDVDGGGRFNGDVNFSGSTGAASTVLFDQSDNSLKFVDNAKAKFGSGNDLEIHHDGTNSVIDNNTGDLNITTTGSGDDIYLDAADDIFIRVQGSESAITCTGNGAVELYHNNIKKLETTADGVDFSGTGSIKVPVGTTGERPTGVAGDFRYNSTTGSFEGYTDEWGAIAGGGGGASETDTSVSSTSATSIYTTAHATNRSVSAVIQITQGSAYQVGRYLVIHDGTTATIIEESAVATGDMLGTFTADINGSNLRILANMSSASSATVTILPTVVTV
jgi:hypothetical protein